MKKIGVILLGIAVVFALASWIGYMRMVDEYMMGEPGEEYYNMLLLVKAVLLGANIIADSILATCYVRMCVK